MGGLADMGDMGDTGGQAAFATLLLGDGRFPSGAHAHSWGLEAAVARGLVNDLDTLERWVEGCLHTLWRTDAGAAVLAWHLARRAAPPAAWVRLDDEVAARLTAALARTAGRTLGRQLLRTASAAWPSPVLAAVGGIHPEGPHAPVALGAVAAVAGVDVAQVPGLSLHHAVLGATTAAVRLLGLDPYAVTGLVARLAPVLAGLAEAARADAAAGDPGLLPATGAPMLDLLLHSHATTEVRFFAT